MKHRDYESLSEAVDDFIGRGYKEDFKAGESHIIALNSRKNYKPEKLYVVEVYRFEGMSNPEDSTELLIIEAEDGTKGTLVNAYGAEHSQNADLIRRIKTKR